MKSTIQARFTLGLSLCALALCATPVRAHDTEGAAPADVHEHHHHHHDMGEEPARRSVVEVALPDVTLVREDGRAVPLREEIQDGRPVLLTFIYTSCTAVCPALSQILAGLQGQLGTESRNLHMMSISIDPEQDTPERLHRYARRYGAGPQWQHYTGSSQDSIGLQRAFGIFRGDKMNHIAVVFLRAAQGNSWVRLDGFATPAELLGEYRSLSDSGR